MKTIFQFNDWPLAIKLLVIMILTALIPITVVGFVNARNTAIALKDEIGDSFEQQANDYSDSVATFLDEQAKLLNTLILNTQITEQLRERNASYQGSEEEILAEILELDELWINAGEEGNSLIQHTLSSDPDVNSVTPALLDFEQVFDQNIEVFVTDIRGATVASTNRLSDYYQADEMWWQVAYNEGQGAIFISDPEFDDSADAFAVLIAVPIFSKGDQGELLGVARTTVTIEELNRAIEAVNLAIAGRVQLLDSQGNVIIDPVVEEMVPLPQNLIDNLLASDTEYLVAIDEEGDRSIFGQAVIGFLGDEGIDRTQLSSKDQRIRQALDNLGWRMIVRDKEAQALAAVATSNQFALLTGFIAIVFAGAAAYGLSRLLTRQVETIQNLFNQIGIGNFKARAEIVSGDELGQMATNLNTMLDNTLNLIQTQEERDRMTYSIQTLLQEVSGVAKGDLTTEAVVTEDITGPIAASFNVMIRQLRQVIGRVQEATLQVSSSANQIQATTVSLSKGSEVQASQIVDTSTAAEQMSVSMRQVSENADLSAEVAKQALQNSRQGTQAVQDTIEGMNRIREQVQETAKRIKRLGESSQEIGEIVQLIRDIAKRTSILALNASLEAAAAGEAGRGFAVVAEDVKRLAERSTKATRQITELVKSIQTETNEAVAAMEESTREVVDGSSLADQAGQALLEIEAVSDRLAGLIGSISNASRQQSQASEAMVVSMQEIAQVTQQTASGTKKAANSITQLAALADDLRGSVRTFKLPNSNGQGSKN